MLLSLLAFMFYFIYSLGCRKASFIIYQFFCSSNSFVCKLQVASLPHIIIYGCHLSLLCSFIYKERKELKLISEQNLSLLMNTQIFTREPPGDFFLQLLELTTRLRTTQLASNFVIQKLPREPLGDFIYHKQTLPGTFGAIYGQVLKVV